MSLVGLTSFSGMIMVIFLAAMRHIIWQDDFWNLFFCAMIQIGTGFFAVLFAILFLSGYYPCSVKFNHLSSKTSLSPSCRELYFNQAKDRILFTSEPMSMTTTPL